MMELKFSCPDCGQHLGYDETLAGQQIECPACRRPIVVPPLIGARASRASEPASLGLSSAPTEAELRAFVGRNAEYYLSKWSLALAGNRQTGGTRHNWAAFLLLGFWLPYRKLYAIACGVWGIALLIGIGSAFLPQSWSVSPGIISLVLIAMNVGFAASANQLYLAKARKTVAEVRARKLSRQEHLAALARRGGNSFLAGLAFPLAFVVAVYGVSFALQSAGVGGPYGKRLAFNAGELYYRPPVTEAQARKLGEYLVRVQYFAATPATVQLLQAGPTVQFRTVVKAGTESEPKNVEMYKVFGEQISRAVFNGEPVEVHLCDPRLQTILSVPAGK